MSDALYRARLRAMEADILYAESLVPPNTRLGRRDALTRRRMIAKAVMDLYRNGEGPSVSEPQPEPVPV